MGQNIQRTHLVRVSHGVQLINCASLAVLDIQPMRVREKALNSKSVLFEQSRCQSCRIVLGGTVSGIVCRTHDALNGDGPAITIAAAVRSVPAGQVKGQILPSPNGNGEGTPDGMMSGVPRTDVIHIVMHTDIIHITIVGGTSVLFRRCCSLGGFNPISVMNRNTNNALHFHGGHCNISGIVLCEQKFVDGQANRPVPSVTS